NHTLRFRSAVDFLETFRAFYGPLVKALAALDDAGRHSLGDELVGLAATCKRKDNAALSIDAEYLEVVATRRWGKSRLGVVRKQSMGSNGSHISTGL
ncbi:MAG TPA: hypothetical protein VED63_00865, partial [Acidimicrobiales bacterium]|nr:hypothetical protein [Acidimicrobiales bacterium]